MSRSVKVGFSCETNSKKERSSPPQVHVLSPDEEAAKSPRASTVFTRAIAPRPLTALAEVRSQAKSCGICSGQTDVSRLISDQHGLQK
jgi:hypothetical protein